jgi:hypothetical protein|tara:strand:- start:2905 stop:3138 length:234 start_codon:yes stop_codon:yes gene_type:complete
MTSNLLDTLTEDCIEKIQLYYIDLRCDDIENSIENVITQMLYVVQNHYQNAKYIKEPIKRFNHVWHFSAFRINVLKL